MMITLTWYKSFKQNIINLNIINNNLNHKRIMKSDKFYENLFKYATLILMWMAIVLGIIALGGQLYRMFYL